MLSFNGRTVVPVACDCEPLFTSVLSSRLEYTVPVVVFDDSASSGTVVDVIVVSFLSADSVFVVVVVVVAVTVSEIEKKTVTSSLFFSTLPAYHEICQQNWIPSKKLSAYP